MKQYQLLLQSIMMYIQSTILLTKNSPWKPSDYDEDEEKSIVTYSGGSLVLQ